MQTARTRDVDVSPCSSKCVDERLDIERVRLTVEREEPREAAMDVLADSARSRACQTSGRRRRGRGPCLRTRSESAAGIALPPWPPPWCRDYRRALEPQPQPPAPREFTEILESPAAWELDRDE